MDNKANEIIITKIRISKPTIRTHLYFKLQVGAHINDYFATQIFLQNPSSKVKVVSSSMVVHRFCMKKVPGLFPRRGGANTDISSVSNKETQNGAACATWIF